MDRQPGLTHPPGRHQRDQPGRRQQPHKLVGLDRSTMERRERFRQPNVGRRRHPRWRELGRAELPQPLGLTEILQPVHAEIDHLDVGHQPSRNVGQQHLSAPPGSHQPCGPVHRRPEVVAIPLQRLAGVEPHSDSDLDAARPVH